MVEDINAMYDYGRNSTPIAQGLVYDINALHACWLRESKRTYGSVSTPIAQGLVEIINAKGAKMVMSPKAQGFVSNTHHGKKKCMLKHSTHGTYERWERGEEDDLWFRGYEDDVFGRDKSRGSTLLPKEDDSNR